MIMEHLCNDTDTGKLKDTDKTCPSATDSLKCLYIQSVSDR